MRLLRRIDRACWDAGQRLARSHWEAVTVVARALAEHQPVTGLEIARLVERCSKPKEVVA